MGTLSRRSPDGHIEDLSVDLEEYKNSEHRALRCISCHTQGFEKYPHPLSLSKVSCLDCHTGDEEKFRRVRFREIDKEFRSSVHFERHADRFSCFRCHNPHTFRRWGEVSGKTIAQQNQVCLRCHDSEINFSQITSERVLPNLKTAHAWLPHFNTHTKYVRCLDCHSSYAPPMRSHLILPKSKAMRDCVQCHSVNSRLKDKLYRHQRAEETSKLGFVNSLIVNNAYIIGATRNRILDALGAILVLGSIGTVGIHTALRARYKGGR